MSSLGALGGPGSPSRASQPQTIPEDEEVEDPDVATLLPDLFSGNWGAEPTPAATAPRAPASQAQKLGGTSKPLQAPQDGGGGSFVLRGSGAPAALPSVNLGQPGDFPGFSPSPPGFGDFQQARAPPKKKPGILSSLTAGPAFLQKQLRKAHAGGGSSPSPPGKAEAPKAAAGRPKLPLKHAVTEPTSKLFDFLRDARAGGADVPEPLIQQLSSMEPQQEEPEELFLPASTAMDRVPFYRRRGFWLTNLLLALWSVVFVGAGLGLFLESQDCPTGCPGPKDAATLVPDGPPISAKCACWGGQGPQCYNPATGECSAACGCVSVQDACWADGCDAGKIGNDSIGWRVMFFLACIPVAAWASQILGWLFVSVISGVEAWAERKEQRQQQREAAARLQRELELELRKRRQLEEDKLRALARMAELGSAKRGGGGGGSGSGGMATGGRLGGTSGGGGAPLAAPAVTAAPPKLGPAGAPLASVLSWQAGLLERAAASARLAGDAPAPLEHASILPPSPQKPAGSAAAALLDGASGMSEVAAKPQAAPKAAEVSQRGLVSGLARFLLGLEASYLAVHIRPQIQRCVFLGLDTGFWAIFWSISYNNVVPDHNQRFWVFFRVLLCLTLMLVVNLITCFISSLTGIKLKRMNHRARMLEVSKREALLQLLLSKGLEDEDDPRAANKLLPPELQPPEAKEAEEGGLLIPQQSLSWRRTSKLLGLGNTLLPLARLGQAVTTTFGAEKRSSSLPNSKGENGDIEQARDGGQSDQPLRRSATDKGLWRGSGRSGSGRSDDPPPSPLTSPKSADSLGLANGAGDSGLPSPSAGSATSDAQPLRPSGRTAGTAAGAPVAERQRVALTSKAGDLSKAHMLADRERHFLEDELRLKYWNARAEALPGPGAVPVTGREDSTVVSSEEDATSLGRFVFHRRLLSFVKLRAQLIKEAKGRQETERAKAAAERARAAREEAAARAARAAQAGGDGAGAAGAVPSSRSMKAVAASIPGLVDMFGSSAEDEEESVAASAAAAPAARGPSVGGAAQGQPPSRSAPSPGRPVARTASGSPAGAPPPGPFAGVPGHEASRPFAAGVVVGGSPAAPAGPGVAAPAPSRTSTFKSAAGRREGLDKDMLRYFLEARGASSETDYAFDVLDRDYDDFLTEENVVRMVRQLYKDRLNLRKGLEGTNTILRKLDLFIGAVLHAIFVIFYLLVWGVAFNDSFYNAFSALLLAFSFIFQSTITNLYENVVFIFVIHPYDVGDVLLLSCTDCGSSSRHEVEEIHLNYTRFLDKENGRVWWPNRTLRDTAFINLTTSEIMEDNFHLLLDLDVAARQPDLLRKIKARLDDYCRKHRGEFDTTGTSVTYRDIMSPMGVLMKAEWRYSHPGTSKERCAKARTGLLMFMAQVLTELGVRYTWPNPFRPGDAPPCRGLGGLASGGPPGGGHGGAGRQAGRGMSSESLAHAHSSSGLASASALPGRLGSQQQLLRGGGVGALGSGGPWQAQRRDSSMDGLALGPGSGLSGPQHTRSRSLSGGLQATPDQPHQLGGTPGGEGGPERARRTESSETVAAEVPLHRLASMGEHSALPGGPSLAGSSLDGAAMSPSGHRGRAGGAEAAGRGSGLAPAGRLSGATLAPTAAGRGARAALALATTLEEPGQPPGPLRLLPEAQIP